jgi:hypothetical protein
MEYHRASMRRSIPLFALALLTACGEGHVEFVEVEGAEHGFVAGGFDGEHNAVAQPVAEAFLLETLGDVP